MEPAIEHDKGIVFREVQRFKQPWLWALILLVAGFAWFTFIWELYTSLSPDGEGGQVWFAGIIAILVGTGLPALFVSSKLIVEVKRDGLYYRYHPFHRRTHRIACEEIEKAESRTYRPIAEYGGWGIRGGWRKGAGRAYNVYGDQGVQLELVDGKRILFGSQRAGEFAAALRTVMGN
ncbi:MAG: hypothetical protein JW854_01805 [Actinobacteria bacterium]|nr:hypothetical protein [Actinomycetota bacterium]